MFLLVFYFCLMDYVELDCKVMPAGENTEILIAWLADIGYSMFEENDQGVKAYIETHLFNQTKLDTIPFLQADSEVKVQCTVSTPEVKNWNEEWEKNFQPVVIGKEIYVRAEYHPSQEGFAHELIIQPRMAFGTGHHATTSLVMEAMLDLDFKEKKVLDMGCGTGILAILAAKMGASQVLAIDIDPNSVENSNLNCACNNTPQVSVLHGDATTPGWQVFDVILANINRNIILEDISTYVGNLTKNGSIITSGYYYNDLKIIEEKANEVNLQLMSQQTRDNWCCAIFVQSNSTHSI